MAEIVQTLTVRDQELLGLIKGGEAHREPPRLDTNVAEASAPSFNNPVVSSQTGEEIGNLSDAAAAVDLSRL